jgi:ABC-type polysaccharide/polyol phosphate export permease
MLSIIPLFFIMLIIRRPITWAVLFIPIPIILLTCFALGVGLLLSSIAVRFPDISEMYQILIQAWNWYRTGHLSGWLDLFFSPGR